MVAWSKVPADSQKASRTRQPIAGGARQETESGEGCARFPRRSCRGSSQRAPDCAGLSRDGAPAVGAGGLSASHRFLQRFAGVTKTSPTRASTWRSPNSRQVISTMRSRKAEKARATDPDNIRCQPGAGERAHTKRGLCMRGGSPYTPGECAAQRREPLLARDHSAEYRQAGGQARGERCFERMKKSRGRQRLAACPFRTRLPRCRRHAFCDSRIPARRGARSAHSSRTLLSGPCATLDERVEANSRC